MPISDVDGYDKGHFGRVHEYIIKPACAAAGFKPTRADEVQATNYIVVDILRKILDAKMVVCDLSSRNPNVLYELGIRQAFNLPVTLMRDSRTPRIFDVQGLRDIEYDESLRIDKINEAVTILATTMKNTSQLDKGEVNSIIQLLGVKPAATPDIEVSKETSLLLESLRDIGERLSRLEDARVRTEHPPEALRRGKGRPLYFDKARNVLRPGMSVRHTDFGEGKITDITTGEIFVEFDNDDALIYILPPTEAREKLEMIPQKGISD